MIEENRRRNKQGSPWDLTNLKPVQDFDVAAAETSPAGIHFSPDGALMFMCGPDSSAVTKYALAAAWDISTATLISSTVIYGGNIDLWFSPDGFKLILAKIGYAQSYTLATAWDPTSFTHIDSINMLGWSLRACTFNDAGDKVIWTNATNQKRARLPTSPFSTRPTDTSRDYTIAGSDNDRSLFVNDIGSDMFTVSGDDKIHHFTLNNPWKADNVSSVGSYSLADSGCTNAQGIYFSPDGSKFFVACEDSMKIYQFRT